MWLAVCVSSSAYFSRSGPDRFVPTAHVGGAWAPNEQHIAPAFGLLCHAVEQDRDRRRADGLLLSRLSYDILGPLPLEEVAVTVSVQRPGRTVELVEAELSCAGRVGVRLRAWLQRPERTEELAGTELPAMPPRDLLPRVASSEIWPGGFIASLDVHRRLLTPGRGQVWVHTDVQLIAGEEVSPTASAVGLLDVANGLSVRADPSKVFFPNVDLTAHLVRRPAGEWIGLDTTVTFGPDGLGLTSTVIHDLDGPLGALQQALTVRPRADLPERNA